MNSEHIGISKNYNIKIISFLEDGKCEILFNDMKLIKKYDSIQKLIKSINECIDILECCGDYISDYQICDNTILLEITTRDGMNYITSTKGLQRRLNSRINFEKHVYENGDIAISSYTQAKEYVKIDHGCGHPYHEITPNSYLSGHSTCPVCCNLKILPYVNDCYTLRPDLMKYFLNQDEIVGVPVNDKTPRKFICPNCGAIKESTLATVSYFGFVCDNCSDGISYPEKYLRSVLDQLGVVYRFHWHPQWCKYKLNDGIEHRGEYDFLLDDYNIIIETDGGLHFEECKSSYYTEYTPIKDKIKERLAKCNGYDVIRINSYYKNASKKADYMRENISIQLSNIFDLSGINWIEADRYATSNIVINACNLWNDGKTVLEISRELNTNNVSIIEYLKRGTTLSLCDYSKELSNLRQAKNSSKRFYEYVQALDVKTNKIVGVFYDIDNFIYNYYQAYNIKLKKDSIRKVYRGDCGYKSVKGMRFERITKSEYDFLVKKKDLINDKCDTPIPIVASNTSFYDLYSKYGIDIWF